MPSSSSEKRKLDNSLSDILFNIIPFFNPKYIIRWEDKKVKKKEGLEISLLEELILSKINKKDRKIKVKRRINDNLSIFEDFFNEKDIIDKINKNDEKIKKENIDYSLELIKENTGEKPYFISIKYEENSEEEKLDIIVKLKNYSLSQNKSEDKKPLKNYLINKIKDKNIKDTGEVYSISIINKKENKDKLDYSLKISYEDNYQRERLIIGYKGEILKYQKRREESMQDFSDRVPGKFVHVFPQSIMGGVLGFTYLGENFMGKREDMVGNKMVDVHESIHTDNEYETRLLTSWILSKEKSKYVK